MDKQTLKQYRWIKDEIDLLAQEKEELVRCYVGAVEMDGMPRGSGTGDMTGSVAAQMWEVAQKMADKMNRLIALRREIEDAIDGLQDSRDRQIIRMRYIDGRKWEQIAVDMNYDYYYVLELHGKALSKLNHPVKPS